MGKLFFLLTAPLATAAFANAKGIIIKNIMPDPPSICDAVSGNLLTDCSFEAVLPTGRSEATLRTYL
jgi:hypothetical protein